MQNYHDSSNILTLLAPLSRDATANGSAIDVKDYVGKLKVVLQSTLGTGTDPTLDVTIEESADGSTNWTAISGAAFTQVTDGAAAVEAIGVSVDGAMRYIRAVATIDGTTPAFVCSVIAIGRKQIT